MSKKYDPLMKIIDRPLTMPCDVPEVCIHFKNKQRLQDELAERKTLGDKLERFEAAVGLALTLDDVESIHNILQPLKDGRLLGLFFVGE